ncbi:MAG: HAD family phosphatase [Verrucomicrobiota bacterium]
MYKAILWDNDGILVDTEALYFKASAEVLASIGIELTHEQFVEISLRDGRSLFEPAIEAGHPLDKIEAWRAERNARYHRSLHEGIEPIEGVRETLAALHGRFRMCVVTSSQRDHFNTIHTGTDLLPFFDFIIALEDVRHTKPDPEPYRTAVERFGLDPRECLAVEDTQRGLVAARGAGVDCVVIPGPFSEGQSYEGATAVIERSRDLIPILESGTGS